MEQAQVKKRHVSQQRANSRYSFEQWEVVRMDFITGKGSLNWCARKGGISYSAVQRRCSKDEWRKQRDDWFKEKKLRDSVPLMAAALNPIRYEGDVPPPQPLSPDYFLAHAQKHHANLDKIADVISENWKMINSDGKMMVTLEERTGLIRETRELIALQRQLLGIPNVAPIRRPMNEKTANGRRQGDIDLAQIRSASDAKRKRIPNEEVVPQSERRETRIPDREEVPEVQGMHVNQAGGVQQTPPDLQNAERSGTEDEAAGGSDPLPDDQA